MNYLWIFIICCATNAIQAEPEADNFCDAYEQDDAAVVLKMFSGNVNTIISSIDKLTENFENLSKRYDDLSLVNGIEKLNQNFENLNKRFDDLSKRQTEQDGRLTQLLQTINTDTHSMAKEMKEHRERRQQWHHHRHPITG